MKVVYDEPIAPASGKRAVVPTMGSLHEGHRQLMREARRCVGSSGEVIVTIFVNPTQFGAGEDFDTYPRDLETDLQVCEEEGVDIVFAPTADTIYPDDADSSIRIDPGPLGRVWEGEQRPGHFAGVLTVVAILLHKAGADTAFFGEKDYQQLVLVRRMCRALAFEVEIVGVPTVREGDGLALSSRNVFLDESQRQLATAIPAALSAAQTAAKGGADAARDAALAVLRDAGLDTQYVAVCDLELGPPPQSGPGRLLVAARVGTTRLLDNCYVELGDQPAAESKGMSDVG